LLLQDYIIVETSGAADPRPVAAALQKLCRLDQVAAVVNAAAAAELASTPLGAAQLLAADVVLLNKCDAVSVAELDAAEAVVRYVLLSQQYRPVDSTPKMPSHGCTHWTSPMSASHLQDVDGAEGDCRMQVADRCVLPRDAHLTSTMIVYPAPWRDDPVAQTARLRSLTGGVGVGVAAAAGPGRRRG
jgi:hypothetical protein